MSSPIGRVAFRATRALRAAGPTAGHITPQEAAARSASKDQVFKKGASRDPELYILGTVMGGAFALAGYYFAGKPTSANSEQTVSMAANSRPWESGTSGKYQYHPGGDRSKAPKDAPSALHSVVIPNVNLPKNLHDQFNKYDKEEFDDY